MGFPVFARRSVFFVQVEWGACALSDCFFADDKPDLFVGKITLARDSRLVALVRATILRLSHSMSAPSSGPYSVPSKSLPGNMVYPSTQGGQSNLSHGGASLIRSPLSCREQPLQTPSTTMIGSMSLDHSGKLHRVLRETISLIQSRRCQLCISNDEAFSCVKYLDG